MLFCGRASYLHRPSGFAGALFWNTQAGGAPPTTKRLVMKWLGRSFWQVGGKIEDGTLQELSKQHHTHTAAYRISRYLHRSIFPQVVLRTLISAPSREFRNRHLALALCFVCCKHSPFSKQLAVRHSPLDTTQHDVQRHCTLQILPTEVVLQNTRSSLFSWACCSTSAGFCSAQPLPIHESSQLLTSIACTGRCEARNGISRDTPNHRPWDHPLLRQLLHASANVVEIVTLSRILSNTCAH